MKYSIVIVFLFFFTTLSAQTTLPPEMVFVQGGTFTMGCTPEQVPCFADRFPARVVRIPSFMIGKYEITQEQWISLMGTNPSNYNWLSNEYPVEQVSFYDCITFCNRLSILQNLVPYYYFDIHFVDPFDSLVGDININVNVFEKNDANGYRLPTEAEWEYAGRGGILSQFYKYAGSNDIDMVAQIDCPGNIVGTKDPNELGIFDMTGNVFEWCYDIWNYYGELPICNDILTMAIRGGCSCATDNRELSARGRAIEPGWRFSYWGIRMAKNP